MSNFCYVCEAELIGVVEHDGKHLCSMECKKSYTLLRALATRLQANEKPELFQPVDLGLSEVDEEEPKELGSFNQYHPICIEAVGVIESDIQYIVKQENDKIVFRPRKKDAMLFENAECAEKFIQEVLKPNYGEKWSFVLWSQFALIK